MRACLVLFNDACISRSCVACLCIFQGMLTLVSNCIDRLNVYNSAAHFGECAGSEAGAAWKDILNLLYELLGKKLVYHTHTHTYMYKRTHLNQDATVINHRDNNHCLKMK